MRSLLTNMDIVGVCLLFTQSDILWFAYYGQLLNRTNHLRTSHRNKGLFLVFQIHLNHNSIMKEIK